MRPEIEAYLREHGSRYTTEALRSQLIAAGHDPAEVDAALRETEAIRIGQAGRRADSRTQPGPCTSSVASCGWPASSCWWRWPAR